MRAGLWYNFSFYPSLSALSEGTHRTLNLRTSPKMSQFNRSETNRDGFLRQDTRGQWYADYKCHEELRRLLTPNGKMYGRKRLNLTASVLPQGCPSHQASLATWLSCPSPPPRSDRVGAPIAYKKIPTRPRQLGRWIFVLPIPWMATKGKLS